MNLALARVMRLRALACLCAAVLAIGWANIAFAQPAFPDRGTRAVVDEANIIDDATEAQLTARLEEFERVNQRQFVIATLPTLDGYEISDYGYQLGRFWGLGDATNNDGIILIIAPNERQMRIETGYGLEAIIPDGLTFEYIEGMKPFFRNGDFSGGIAWGTDQIIRQLELPPEEAAAIAQQVTQQRSSDGGFPFGALIWIGIVFFFFVLPLMRERGRKRRYRGAADTVGDIILWEVGSAIVRGALSGGDDWGGGGGGFGGGGFGGGGFGGGGGSFGGGGASGGW